MKAYQKKRLKRIQELQEMLPRARTILQRFNILEEISLLKRMIKIDELTEKRLKPQLLKKGKK
jgi:uncharacterized protein (DUF4213/DUF364 family)